MMKQLIYTILALAGNAVAATTPNTRGGASVEADRVTHLPGYNAPLPSPWYSGYLTYNLTNQTIHTHYVLVMAERLEGETAEDQSKKPLIYWSNGGPGKIKWQNHLLP